MSKTAIWTISMPKTLEKQALSVMGDKMKSEFVREILRKYLEGQVYLTPPAQVTDKKKVLEVVKRTFGAWGKGGETGAEYQRRIKAEPEMKQENS